MAHTARNITTSVRNKRRACPEYNRRVLRASVQVAYYLALVRDVRVGGETYLSWKPLLPLTRPWLLLSGALSLSRDAEGRGLAWFDLLLALWGLFLAVCAWLLTIAAYYLSISPARKGWAGAVNCFKMAWVICISVTWAVKWRPLRLTPTLCYG